MKSNLLYVAMVLLILCLPFRGNEHEIHWLWADRLWIPLTLGVLSLLCIARYLYKQELVKSGN